MDSEQEINSGPGLLRATIARTMREERMTATSATMALRRVMSFSFLAIIGALTSIAPAAHFEQFLLPLSIHAGFSVFTLFIRNRKWIVRLAPAAAMLDVLVIAGAQAAAIPMAPNPMAMASLGLGFFAMVLALNALSMRTDVLLSATVTALVMEILILWSADSSIAATTLASVALVVVSASGYALVRRMKEVLVRFAEAELAKEAESSQRSEIEAARRTIESMLAESRARNDQLERLQRDKDALTQLLVHDLRAPITVMMGYLDFVRSYLDESAMPPAYAKALAHASGTGNRLSKMINELLQIARLEEGRLILEPRPLEPSRLVEELALEAEGLVHGRHVDFRTNVRVAPGVADGRVEADVALLRRVLTNLVANAARYTPDGRRLELSVNISDDEAVFAVQNDGTPIAPEVRERIFEKYGRGSSDPGGQGLGLYFCRLAVEAHGGTIAIEDREGFSTSFIVRIPRQQPHPSVLA